MESQVRKNGKILVVFGESFVFQMSVFAGC